MATFLDIGLVQQANWLFGFILVFVLVYAILSYKQFLNMSKLTSTTVAICVAFLMLLSPAFLNVITISIPWVTIGIIFIIFVLLTLFTLGVTPEDIKATLDGPSNGSTIKNTVIILIAIIFVAALASQFSVFTGEDTAPAPTQNASQQTHNVNAGQPQQTEGIAGQGQDAVIAILFHPQVLGLLAIMLIAIFATILLSTNVR